MHQSLFTLTETAIKYTWRQLAQRAGITGGNPQGTGFEGTHLPVYYTDPGRGRPAHPALFVVPCDSAAWDRLLQRAPHSLDWLPTHRAMPPDSQLPIGDSIPVLFWGAGYEDGSRPFAERREDGSVVFYVDVVAAAFFMLSRWEETVRPARDEHERFPAAASVAHQQGFLDRPVVDEYALILRQWLKVLLPGWEPRLRPFSVKLSHDIDSLGRFPNWPRAFRTVGRELIKRRNPSLAWQFGVDAIAQVVAPDHTQFFQGICSLAEWSRTCGIGGDAFYFMAAEPGPQDNGYDPASPLVKRCMAELREQGFEIGLHAGYHTLNNPERLAAEKARLDAVLGETRYGGRQHFLRFRVPHTWRYWEQVGLAYDSTMTYPGYAGFRCGTCHPFRPFDVEQNRELNLWERPLIVMDQTLRLYRELAPEQGEKRIVELAQRCRQVEGTFTLLWHNTSLSGEWRPWVKAYRRVVKAMAEVQE